MSVYQGGRKEHLLNLPFFVLGDCWLFWTQLICKTIWIPFKIILLRSILDNQRWVNNSVLEYYSKNFCATRPTPHYGRQGLAGKWGKDTVRRVHFGVSSTFSFALTFGYSCLQPVVGQVRLDDFTLPFFQGTFKSNLPFLAGSVHLWLRHLAKHRHENEDDNVRLDGGKVSDWSPVVFQILFLCQKKHRFLLKVKIWPSMGHAYKYIHAKLLASEPYRGPLMGQGPLKWSQNSGFRYPGFLNEWIFCWIE